MDRRLETRLCSTSGRVQSYNKVSREVAETPHITSFYPCVRDRVLFGIGWRQKLHSTRPLMYRLLHTVAECRIQLATLQRL